MGPGRLLLLLAAEIKGLRLIRFNLAGKSRGRVNWRDKRCSAAMLWREDRAGCTPVQSLVTRAAREMVKEGLSLDMRTGTDACGSADAVPANAAARRDCLPVFGGTASTDPQGSAPPTGP